MGAPGPSHLGTWESKTPVQSRGLKWLVVTGLTLGAILLACGVVLFVSAHWDQLGPGERYLLVIAIVAVFHIAGGLTRSSFEGFSTALHAVGTISTGAAIALVGQIFNIQEHWPAAVLLWALAAFAGWALLRDQAQQTLALLLLPAWIFCELGFRIGGHVGERRLRGPALLSLGHPILHVFRPLAAQGGAGNSFRGQHHRCGHRHRSHVERLGSHSPPIKPSFPSARASGPGSQSPPSRSSSPHFTVTKAWFPSPPPSCS